MSYFYNSFKLKLIINIQKGTGTHCDFIKINLPYNTVHHVIGSFHSIFLPTVTCNVIMVLTFTAFKHFVMRNFSPASCFLIGPPAIVEKVLYIQSYSLGRYLVCNLACYSVSQSISDELFSKSVRQFFSETLQKASYPDILKKNSGRFLFN